MPFFLPNAYSFSSNHSHEEKKNRFMYLVAVFFLKADLQLEAHFPYVAVAITPFYICRRLCLDCQTCRSNLHRLERNGHSYFHQKPKPAAARWVKQNQAGTIGAGERPMRCQRASLGTNCPTALEALLDRAISDQVHMALTCLAVSCSWALPQHSQLLESEQ